MFPVYNKHVVKVLNTSTSSLLYKLSVAIKCHADLSHVVLPLKSYVLNVIVVPEICFESSSHQPGTDIFFLVIIL